MGADLLYVVEREFAHPVDRLWYAWTDAAALEQWYCPTELAVVPGSVVSEIEVGGAWTAAVDVAAHGFVAYFFGRYTRIEPLTALEHTMSFTMSEQEFAARDVAAPSHVVVVEFVDRGQHTWVKFAQFGELPEGEPDRAKAGMETYFDSLQAFLG
ncbi:MAG: SRPBCC domain-containing protein [Actinomycetes bacterium]|jgi:uncharacterized protein YndB with AHSA1/START domain